MYILQKKLIYVTVFKIPLYFSKNNFSYRKFGCEESNFKQPQIQCWT